MYKLLIRPLLFLLSAERAHRFTFGLLKFWQALPGAKSLLRALFDSRDAELEREVFGLRFRNPIGLAAGFDKDAEVFEALGAMGFGFVEVGTVTPKPQPGNPQPRLFRLPLDRGLINRMGFNNRGTEAMVNRLRRRSDKTLIVGGNIGKNKLTPNEEALNDYLLALEALHPHVDYFVVNVSSPNTPGLRELQDKEPLAALLSAVQERNRQLGAKPLLLKIAPDLTNGQLDDIVEIASATGLSGVVATNTTISRQGLQTASAQVEAIGTGGLSGKPLTSRSTEVIRYLKDKSRGRLTVIGVGGIFSAADALEKLRAGADLLQVYTGFIYEGPGLPRKLNKAVKEAVKKGNLKWNGK